MKVTLKQIAQKKGISKWAVIKRKHKEGWRPCEVIEGRGGKIELFALSDLPEDIQELFKPPLSTPDGDKPIEQASGRPLSTGQGRTSSPVLMITKEAPEKARRIALARYDLLRLWRRFRGDDEVKDKSARDKEFLKGYNSGVMYPEIFKILGEVSLKTLYRWQQLIGASDDYRTLIPQSFKGRDFPSLSPEEAETFMRFLLHPNRLSIGSAITLTKALLENRGIRSKSSAMKFRRFAEVFKKEHYDRWVLMREGQKALKDRVEPFIRRDPSMLEVGDVLVADGHRLNFQVINPFTGKPCRATLVGYIDWKSYDLVGYEIMIEENTQCIASALRQAILRLGKIPKITYQDNGKAFRARFFTSTESLEEAGIYGLFARLGIIPVFAQPYNARAKIIEGWFKNFSGTFERLLPSYTGSSISDKPARLLRNERLHRAIHREYIPTIEETIQLIEKWLDFYRAQPCPHVPGRTIGEVFSEGKGEGVEVSELDDLMLSIKKTKISRNGIRFLNAEYFNENLYGIKDEVIIRYSLFDLSFIKVYTLQGEYLGIAERVMPVHPMAQYLGEVKDYEQLKHALAQQKRLAKETEKSSKQLWQMLSRAPELDWQKISQDSDRINLQAPASVPEQIPEQIPEEAVKKEEIGQQKTEDISQPGERPFFGLDMIARYEWHLKNGFITPEDLEFKKEFEASLAFKALQSFEKQDYLKEV